MLNKKDLKIETMRGSTKAGGQHLNKTDSCVRITHIPTGVVVTINGRDQHSNKREALKELEKRLKELKRAERAKSKKARRDKAIKEGKTIRTYNYKSGTVKNHLNGKKASIKDVVEKGRIDLLK